MPIVAPRQYISLYEFEKLFPDENAALAFYESLRWTDGVRCPSCGGGMVFRVSSGKPQPYRCRPCRRYFSVTVGTIMERSHISLRTWLLVTYIMTVARKGISSHQVAREIGITQRSAWYLLHRIRDSWAQADERLAGIIEVDETYIGGRERNKHASKRMHQGGGPKGKAIVFGLRSRETGRVVAFPIRDVYADTLSNAIRTHTEPDAIILSDEWKGYNRLRRMGYRHEQVKHRAHEYVRDGVHTNSIESFWALFKRAYHGTHHWMSFKHLHRYVTEMAERQNTRHMEALERIAHFARLSFRPRTTYGELTT